MKMIYRFLAQLLITIVFAGLFIILHRSSPNPEYVVYLCAGIIMAQLHLIEKNQDKTP